jgi:glycerol uptake facilitator-like aquaporin
MTLPTQSDGAALLLESVLSCLLLIVILGTATQHRVIGANVVMAAGATIALAGLIAAPISGASLNPARSLGPAIVSARLDDAWIYVAGPLIGATVAVAITWLLHGSERDGDEDEAATGDRGKNASASSSAA